MPQLRSKATFSFLKRANHSHFMVGEYTLGAPLMRSFCRVVLPDRAQARAWQLSRPMSLPAAGKKMDRQVFIDNSPEGGDPAHGGRKGSGVTPWAGS